MRPRLRQLDLNGSTYFMSASDRLVEVAQIGLDAHDSPVFRGGCRIYAVSGDVIGVQRERENLHPDDLVVDILHDTDQPVPLEVLLATAHGLAESYVHSTALELPVGEAMQREHVVIAIDTFLVDYDRFHRFRDFLINSAAKEWGAEQEEA